MDWLESLLKPTIEIKILRIHKTRLVAIKAYKTVVLRCQHGEFRKVFRRRERLLEMAKEMESLVIYPDGSVKHNKLGGER